GVVTGEPTAPVHTTWGEVHEQARRAAGALIAGGLGKHDAVAGLAAEPAAIGPAAPAGWPAGGSGTLLQQPTPPPRPGAGAPRPELGVGGGGPVRVLVMVGPKVGPVGGPVGAAGAGAGAARDRLPAARRPGRWDSAGRGRRGGRGRAGAAAADQRVDRRAQG